MRAVRGWRGLDTTECPRRSSPLFLHPLCLLPRSAKHCASSELWLFVKIVLNVGTAVTADVRYCWLIETNKQNMPGSLVKRFGSGKCIFKRRQYPLRS